MKKAALGLALAVVFAGGCAGMNVASNQPVSASGIKGQIALEGTAAAAGVYVYAYTSTQNDMRGPSELTPALTAADGTYTLNLAPGTYHIVARKRLSGKAAGNLAEGDLEGKFPANPVVVKAGEFTPVNLTVAGLPGMFLLAPFANIKGDMGLTGMVVADDGTPVAHAYVMLYSQKDRIGRPTFLSKPTDANGEYSVYPTKPGTYYVAARASYGSLPRKGEPYGTYDQNPEAKIELQEKTLLTGVDITMTTFTRDLTKCAEH